MAREVTETVYRYDELSESAKEKARRWWIDLESRDFDPVWSIEDAERVAEILGFTFAKRSRMNTGGRIILESDICYSGFYCQGDGLSFTGRYAYAKGAAKAIRLYAPQDSTLHRIADDLTSLQRRHFYKVKARITRMQSRYCHSGVMQLELIDSPDTGWPGVEDLLLPIVRRFADWIYSQIESEYQDATSDENAEDCIVGNGYEFNSDGGLYNAG